jgi:hypothetical protein
VCLIGAAMPAGTARADQMLSGTYALITTATDPSTWRITSACTPGCIAAITSSQGWRGYATLDRGLWAMAVYLGHWLKSSYPADPANCPAAGGGGLVQNWSWSADALSGTVTTVTGDECGGPVTTSSAPMRLAKTP